MKVLILGFDNVDEITPVMEKLINESQCYLFNIICGGLGPMPENPTPAAIWAKNNELRFPYNNRASGKNVFQWRSPMI